MDGEEIFVLHGISTADGKSVAYGAYTSREDARIAAHLFIEKLNVGEYEFEITGVDIGAGLYHEDKGIRKKRKSKRHG